jgi:prepilin-type processing-associated H-X9-DG protein
MKNVAILLCLTLALNVVSSGSSACAASAVQPPPAATPADLSSPQKALEAFFAALNRTDLQAMVPCVLEAAVTPELEQLQKELARNNPLPGKAVLSRIKVYKDEKGEEALVSFELGWQPSTDESSEEVVLVRKVGDVWKMVAPDPLLRRSRNAIDSIDTASNLTFLVRYPKAVLAGRAMAKEVNSLSNVKQISLGLIMYAQDYDEVFIPDAARFKETILPYIKSEAVFTSPFDPAGTISYKFNPQLVRKSMAKIAEPANTVMVFEGEHKKLLFRYDGKAVVGFADGHAKFVTPEEAKKLRWTP